MEPCKYCPMKGKRSGFDGCKADLKDGVDRLVDSHAIESAKSIIDDYDYEETRVAVLNRWKAEDKVPA